MTSHTFGLFADVPEAALDPEWRALVSQQARTLAGMLQRLQHAVAGGQQRTDARRHATARVHALAADAERLLTAQAQEQVSLERELAAAVRRAGTAVVPRRGGKARSGRTPLPPGRSRGARWPARRGCGASAWRGQICGGVWGYKDASEAWAAGALAVGGGPTTAAAVVEGKEMPRALRERWEERAAIMAYDGKRPRAAARRGNAHGLCGAARTLRAA